MPSSQAYFCFHTPLPISCENKLIEIKAVRNPIGFYPKEKKFITHKIQLHNNDMIYLFSDGYQDQFSAIKKRKFTKTEKNCKCDIFRTY